MGATCSRRKQEPEEIKDVNVVVSDGGGRTVKMLVGTRYNTGEALRTRAAGLFSIPQAEAVLMCGAEKVDDEEELLKTRRSALLGAAPQLQLLRSRRHMAMSGAHSGGISIWDVERGEITKKLPPEHLGGIWCLEVNWASQRCVSGSDDKTLRVWDMDRARAGVCRGHEDGVTCVSVDWSQNCILSGSLDKTMKQWNMKDNSCVKTFSGHESGVQCLSVDWTAKEALSGSLDKTLRLWTIENGDCTKTFEGHEAAVTDLRVDWVSRRAVSSSCAKPQIGPAARRHLNGWERLRGGGVAAEQGNNLKLWDVDSGSCLKTFAGHERDILGIDVDWASQRILTAGVDKVLKQWNLESGECLTTYSGHTEFLTCVRADWAARKAITGSGNTEIRMWDLDSAECLSVWKLDDTDCSMNRGQVRVLNLEPFPSKPPA